MKKTVVLCMLFTVLLPLAACSNKTQTSTPLNGVVLDGTTIGNTLEDIDSEKYTLSEHFSELPNTVNYEEWQITTDESGTIIRIQASFADIQISINTVVGLHNIDDVIKVLGENYTTEWYDKEQQLKQAQYVDKRNMLQCSFIYDGTDNRLVWLIIEKR